MFSEPDHAWIARRAQRRAVMANLPAYLLQEHRRKWADKVTLARDVSRSKRVTWVEKLDGLEGVAPRWAVVHATTPGCGTCGMQSDGIPHEPSCGTDLYDVYDTEAEAAIVQAGLEERIRAESAEVLRLNELHGGPPPLGD